MSLEQIQFLANFRQFHGVKQQVTKVLSDETLSREEKVKQLLTNESLKMCLNQGNQKLVDFLCEKESLELLIYYSVAVPEDPTNRDESYKFPFVAQELLCQSGMIAESLVDGGLIENQEEIHDEEEDDEYESDGTDERDEAESPEPSKEKAPPSKIGLKPKFNNKLTIKTEDDDEPKDPEEEDKKKEEDFDPIEEKEVSSEDKILEDRKKQYEVNQETAEEGKDEDSKEAEEADHEKIEIKINSQEENGDIAEPEEEDAGEEDVAEGKEKEKKTKKSLKFSSKKLKKGTGKALEEKPAEEKPAEEKPSDEKAADEEKPSEEKSSDDKASEEKPQVSDDFLKMKLDNPSYLAKEDSKDEADFERDEDDTKDSFQNPRTQEEQERAEQENKASDIKEVEDENVDSTEEGGSANPVKVKIRLFMKPEERRRKKKVKPEGEEIAKIKANTIELLDKLFSFLGITSSEEPLTALETLNMFSENTHTYSSRNTAGTTERQPGPLSTEEREEISARSAREIPKSRGPKEYSSSPELLPVTCGYFGNIVRQLLMKQRKSVLKYLLKDTQGAIFEKLLHYVHYHSLSELLVELMQVTLEKYGGQSTQSTSINDDDSDEDSATQPAQDDEPADLQEMKRVLNDKKVMVIQSLIQKLSHGNTDDLEGALNASSILIEIVEASEEKGFQFLFLNDADFLNQIMELALDPTNSFCQRYMMQVLVALMKKLKASGRNQPFRDLEEKSKFEAYQFCGMTITEAMQDFDPRQQRQRNILDFLGLAREHNFVNSLILMLQSNECNFSGDKHKVENPKLFVENQFGHHVRKMGPTKLTAMELLYHFLLLLFPSFGDLYTMQSQGQEKPIPQPPHPDISQDRYITKNLLRYLIKTIIYIMREYSYCNMALELSAFILAEVRTMFDIIDIVTLQKFVIQEFRERHLKLRILFEESGEEVSRFKLDHMNMQSAQVNQIALQLKEKDALITQLYSGSAYKEMSKLKVGYFDLISDKDNEFWSYLMKRDLVRIEKLQALGLGENHNFDQLEGDSADEEQVEKPQQTKEDEEARALDDEVADDMDHDSFMTQMMRQRTDEKEKEEEEEASKNQEYQDNQYWNNNLMDDQLDVDELLEDYD